MEPYWFEVAVVVSIFAVGKILFERFEEGVPKWRRVAKFFALNGLGVLISATAGRPWFYGFLGVGLALAAISSASETVERCISPYFLQGKGLFETVRPTTIVTRALQLGEKP